jgi:Sec-independent protein translocase protein TatA
MLAFGLPAAPECTFILILALLLFGPKKMPMIARRFAKILADLNLAKEEFQREILLIPPAPKIQEPLEKKIHLNTSMTPLQTDVTKKG